MVHLIVFSVGGLVGYILASVVSASGDDERMQEAYNAGFERGYNVGSEHGKDIAKGEMWN